MKILRRSFFTALLAAAVSLTALQAEPDKDGWISLFNGKDLAGWVEVGKEKWTVEEGEIKGEAISKAYGYLQTEKTYKDFVLSLHFKCEGDGNSGVFFHTGFKPGTADVSGNIWVAGTLVGDTPGTRSASAGTFPASSSRPSTRI